MKIFYGQNESFIDITNYFIDKNIIDIPVSDKDRAALFSDPLVGVVKVIKIIDDYDNTSVYDINTKIYIERDENNKFKNNITLTLPYIHSKLKFKYGSLLEEYPEQEMALNFIKPNNCVLEIGGNIGRNSCVIAMILNDSKNLLVVECDLDNAAKLTENKIINYLQFKIEDSAISKIELVQKGWDTKPKDDNSFDWQPVKTITWENLLKKYNMKFDTFVLDCEGAFYYILLDEPNILNDIKTIIIENDFYDINHKKFVDEQFIMNGFKNVFRQSGGFGPCMSCFYEVWQK